MNLTSFMKLHVHFEYCNCLNFLITSLNVDVIEFNIHVVVDHKMQFYCIKNIVKIFSENSVLLSYTENLLSLYFCDLITYQMLANDGKNSCFHIIGSTKKGLDNKFQKMATKIGTV